MNIVMVLGQISQLLEALPSICVEEERAHTTDCCKGQKPDCTCNVPSLGGHSSHCTAVVAVFSGPSDPWTCGLRALWPLSEEQVKVSRFCSESVNSGLRGNQGSGGKGDDSSMCFSHVKMGLRWKIPSAKDFHKSQRGGLDSQHHRPAAASITTTC